jgi:hypothetical protein
MLRLCRLPEEKDQISTEPEGHGSERRAPIASASLPSSSPHNLWKLALTKANSLKARPAPKEAFKTSDGPDQVGLEKDRHYVYPTAPELCLDQYQLHHYLRSNILSRRIPTIAV